MLDIGVSVSIRRGKMTQHFSTQRTRRHKVATIMNSLCGLCILCAFALIISAIDARVAAAEGKEVAAKVNGEPVLASEAEQEFRAAYGDRQFSAAQRQQLMKAALDQVIDRRLVMAYLAKNGQSASKEDVTLALAQFEKDLKAQNLTLAQHCEKVGLSPDDIRRSLAWKLSWKRYCEKYLTPANLEKYFDKSRRDFDGTQLRVAQILFKLPAAADDAAVSAAKDRAAKLRQEITSGKIPFSNAAKQNSEAPSKEAGGDI